VKVKNIYVTERHKLRYTDYTGKEKRARESWRTPRPAKLDWTIGAKRAGRLPQGGVGDSALALTLPVEPRRS
jgi:hypothetical protein